VIRTKTEYSAPRLINRYARLMLDEGDGRVSEHLELVRDGGKVWLKYKSRLYADHPLLTESALARNVCGAGVLWGHARSLKVALPEGDSLHPP